MGVGNSVHLRWPLFHVPDYFNKNLIFKSRKPGWTADFTEGVVMKKAGLLFSLLAVIAGGVASIRRIRKAFMRSTKAEKKPV